MTVGQFAERASECRFALAPVLQIELPEMEFESWVWFLVAGQPVPKVRWMRNDVMVASTTPRRKNPAPAGVVSAQILIDHLDRKDVHSELTCQAINNNKSAPVSASVHVDMNCK
jgi:CD80-like C2-set immunoglobulin domain